MHPILIFTLVFVIIAPLIAIAGTAAGHPWGEISLFVAGGLVAYASVNGLRSILRESEQLWHKRGGSQMRVIVGLAMVGGVAVLIALGALLFLIVNLSRLK
jgi:hypothetical protein